VERPADLLTDRAVWSQKVASFRLVPDHPYGDGGFKDPTVPVPRNKVGNVAPHASGEAQRRGSPNSPGSGESIGRFRDLVPGAGLLAVSARRSVANQPSVGSVGRR
jgi:hypothetical protein